MRQCTWILPRVSAYERLNIVSGARVNAEFLSGLEDRGQHPWDRLLEYISAHDEASIRWHLMYAFGYRLSEDDRFKLYKGDIRHHLPGGNVHSHHHEHWLFGALSIDDVQTAFFPVQRLSELSSDFDVDASRTTESDELFLDKMQLRFVSERIGDMAALKKLWLSNNILDEGSLPSSFARLCNLEFLCLTNNRFTRLPFGILARLRRLEFLVADHNPLASVHGIRVLSELKWLDLNSCGLAHLSADVARLTNLCHLEVHGNHIAALPDDIGDLGGLQYFSAHDNWLSSLPCSMGRLRALRWCSLHSNRLSSVPDELGELQCLLRLSLHYNRLTSVPKGLPSLLVLSLFGNRLARVPCGHFANWTQCTTLALQRNELRELPEDIGCMSSLTDLWLFSNRLEALPSSVGRLRSLERVWLDKNPLRSLPRELLQCGNLKVVYASDTLLPADLEVPASCRVVR